MRTLPSLLLALVALVLVAPSADADSRDLGAFGDGTLVTDGRGYVAILARGSTQVLDLQSGERQRIDVPPPCSGRGVSANMLVVSCPLPAVYPPHVYASGYTIDLRTGGRADLPPLTVAAFGTSAVSGYYDEAYRAVGRRWAEIREVEYHGERPRFLELTTGAVSYGAGNDLSLVADLDAPSGVRRLCRPLRRPLVPDPAFQYGLVPGELSQAGPFAAGVYYREDAQHREHSRVEIGRCGAPSRVIHRCAFFCEGLTLDRRTLAWVESRGSSLHPYRIAIRSLRTGKTRRITRPVAVQMQLVRGELLVLSGGRLRAITP